MDTEHHRIFEIRAKPDVKMFVFVFVRNELGNLTTMQRFSKKIVNFTKDELISVREVFDENN